MNSHADTTHSAHEAVAHDPAADSHAAVGGMRFEKSELHEFVEADRSAGEHVGILLAVVFCISIVLMVGVTYWTFHNQTEGHDPHTIPGIKEAPHH